LVPPPWLRKLSLWLALATAGAILIGVSPSQILMAVALGVLLLSGLPLRWPRISLPLGLFLLWTLVALAASPDPKAGMDQVRKMLVFAILLIVFSAVTKVKEARLLALLWMAVGTVTAGRGLYQFLRDMARAQASGRDFYHEYIADRIRGFMSHWMTFSGQELFILLLLVAFLLFAPGIKRQLWIAVPCAVIVLTALVLSNTRSVWLAALVGGIYLLWSWRKWAVAIVPVALAAGFVVAPGVVQTRVKSITDPQGQTDSNLHRSICRRVGWRMIQAHPLLGVGPDEIKKEAVFFAYLPADVPLPLPEGYYGHLHNFYIQYAAERGIPAALFITGALLIACWRFRKALAALPPGRSDRRFLLQASVAIIIGTMVAGVFEYNLNDSEVLTMFLAMMCLGETAV
jgi:O-antigen ligase